MRWFYIHHEKGSISARPYQTIHNARLYNKGERVTEARVCINCEHSACPMCGESCDVLLEPDYDFCCDGKCTFAPMPMEE